MSEMLTADMFQPHVNKVFRVKDGRHALTLNRIELRRMEQRELDELGRQSFTLVFAGPPGDVLPDGLYTLEVEGGPSFELFVMPIRTLVRGRHDKKLER